MARADGLAANGEEEPGHRRLLVGETERTQYRNAIPQFAELHRPHLA
jgi:hypothetical protein